MISDSLSPATPWEATVHWCWDFVIPISTGRCLQWLRSMGLSPLFFGVTEAERRELRRLRLSAEDPGRRSRRTNPRARRRRRRRRPQPPRVSPLRARHQRALQGVRRLVRQRHERSQAKAESPCGRQGWRSSPEGSSETLQETGGLSHSLCTAHAARGDPPDQTRGRAVLIH